MSEQFKQHSSSGPQHEDSDVVQLIKKMQQQLIYLERKIDTLLNQQPQERPYREKRFSKPYQSFGNSQHSHGNRDREHSPREGNFSKDRPFKKPYGEPRREYGPKKKPFPFKRNDRA